MDQRTPEVRTDSTPRKQFVAPKLERHDKLPELTGFSF